MAVELQRVEIPGYADAVKREQRVRREAWVHVRHELAGVPVRSLTLRDMELLEEMRNGFFAPWRFDSDEEYLSHCAQLVWWLSDCPKPDRYRSTWRDLFTAKPRKELIAQLATRPAQLARDVAQFMRDQFMDAPKGQSGIASAATAAGPAYIFDTLAAGGYHFSADEILDMPLPRLWQLVRLVQRRVFGVPLTNPSDNIATAHLAATATGGPN
jgi:hypothetical protein